MAAWAASALLGRLRGCGMGGVAGGCGGGRGLTTGSTVAAPRRSTATATWRPDLRVRLHLTTYLRPHWVAALLHLFSASDTSPHLLPT
eukprot:1661466-Prymnesium_polylepis.1